MLRALYKRYKYIVYPLLVISYIAIAILASIPNRYYIDKDSVKKEIVNGKQFYTFKYKTLWYKGEFTKEDFKICKSCDQPHQVSRRAWVLYEYLDKGYFRSHNTFTIILTVTMWTILLIFMPFIVAGFENMRPYKRCADMSRITKRLCRGCDCEDFCPYSKSPNNLRKANIYLHKFLGY